MNEFANIPAPADPDISVELAHDSLSVNDLNDLCDATDLAIQDGGGFGWVNLPAREILERYWQGVITMPLRLLFIARIDGVICGTCQVVIPPSNNEAQAHAVQLTTTFVAPWARGHGIGEMLIQTAETTINQKGHSVINLDVRETMHVAIALYEKLGYTRYATHPDYARVNGETLQGFFYTKTLS